MENRINIAEILKKCPKGMELDCTMFEDVKFIDIDEADKPICIKTGVLGTTNDCDEHFKNW
jgi:hypothetical protein